MYDTLPQLGLDAILPAQWPLRHHQLSGEQRLALAVLEDAWWLLSDERHAGHLEAVDWLYDEGDDGPFAFENIVAVLHLGSPRAIRQGLLRKTRPQRLHGRRR